MTLLYNGGDTLKIITKHDFIKSSSHIENSVKYADDEQQENEEYHKESSLKYVNSREHSAGLFNLNGKMSDNDISDDLDSMRGKTVHRIILSQSNEDVKLDSPKKYEELIKKNIGLLADTFNVSPSEIRWNAGFHEKDNKNGDYQPHLHMHIWSINNNLYTDEKKITMLRENLIKQMYSQELKKHELEIKGVKTSLYHQKDKVFSSVSNQLRLYCKEIFPTEEYQDILMDLKFTRYYQYLGKREKALIDSVVMACLNSSVEFEEMVSIEMKLKNLYTKFYGEYIDDTPIVNKYIHPGKDDRKEFQNIVLNELRGDKIKIKYERTSRMEKGNTENLKEYLADSKTKRVDIKEGKERENNNGAIGIANASRILSETIKNLSSENGGSGTVTPKRSQQESRNKNSKRGQKSSRNKQRIKM